MTLASLVFTPNSTGVAYLKVNTSIWRRHVFRLTRVNTSLSGVSAARPSSSFHFTYIETIMWVTHQIRHKPVTISGKSSYNLDQDATMMTMWPHTNDVDTRKRSRCVRRRRTKRDLEPGSGRNRLPSRPTYVMPSHLF